MDVNPALALPEGLHLVGLEQVDEILTLTVVSTPLSPCCPLCGKAAPQARQIADRFHLYKNLGEALEGVLARHLAAHRRGTTENFSATPLGVHHPNCHRNRVQRKPTRANRSERSAWPFTSKS
jgi:hypothetical protein